MFLKSGLYHFAKLFMRLKVFLLAFNVAILNNVATLTSNDTHFFTDRTNTKVRPNLIICANFIRHISFHVTNVGIRA
jgi:hypothetical protein